jgi:glycosyltransferase involved in cell wall biosynthesis
MAMRVAFDTSVTETDPGGISRYVIELLAAFARQPNGIELVPISMSEEWPWTRNLERHLKVLAHDQLWVGKGQVSACQRVEAEIVHGSAFKVAAVADPATSVTIHDDTPWDDPPTASLYNRVNLQRTLRRAAPLVRGALVSTDTTANAILQHLPELNDRIHVTPFGINHEAFRPVPEHLVERVRRAHGILGPYILMVGPYGPRKNFPAMVQAISQIQDPPQGLTIVVTGRPAKVTPMPVPVIHTGFVGDEELAALYSGAEFLFYTSLSEGFGFPVLEAMACGCPVLTSSGTVLEELAGESALLAVPSDVEALTAACETLLRNRDHRRQIAAKGLRRAQLFDWDQTAAATAQAWREMSQMEAR